MTCALIQMAREDKRQEKRMKKKNPSPLRQTEDRLISASVMVTHFPPAVALDPYISLSAAIFPNNLTLFLAASWQCACGPPQGKV